MSEQGPIQSSVSVFVEWAKARLDEMAAIAKVLNSRLDSLDANGRAQAEQAIAHVKQWNVEGQAQIKDVQAKGEASIAEAKARNRGDVVQVSERIWQMGRTGQRPASGVSSERPGPGQGVAKRREQLYAARRGTPRSQQGAG